MPDTIELQGKVLEEVGRARLGVSRVDEAPEKKARFTIVEDGQVPAQTWAAEGEDLQIGGQSWQVERIIAHGPRVLLRTSS